MNSIVVSESDLSKLRKIKSPCNYESNIYINKDKIYKILFDDANTIKREENIEQMSSLSHPNCVFPEGKLVNENNEFVGVYEQYLKEYKTFVDYLKSNNIDFEERKNITHKICQIQKYLESINLSFIDLHTSNIMTDGKDIKVIDLDSSEFMKKRLSLVFDYIRQDLICRNLSCVVYQILLNTNLDIYNMKKDTFNKLLKISSYKQSDLILKLMNQGDIIDVEDYIDLFNEDYVEESKLILHV